MQHYVWLSFNKNFVEMGSHYVSQDGLKFLASSDPPALISESVGIIGMKTVPRFDSFFLSLFLRWNLTLLPRLECSGTISALWTSASLVQAVLCLSLPSSWDYR